MTLSLHVLPACMPSGKLEGGYYSLEDFAAVEKYDTHVHINTPDASLVEQAAADNFRLLTINVDAPHYPPIPEQQRLSQGRGVVDKLYRKNAIRMFSGIAGTRKKSAIKN